MEDVNASLVMMAILIMNVNLVSLSLTVYVVYVFRNSCGLIPETGQLFDMRLRKTFKRGKDIQNLTC